MLKDPASRRSALGLLAGGLAAACAPEKSSPFWGTIGAGFRAPANRKIDPDYVRNLPYATMMAWFEGGPKALIVLGEVTANGRYTWYSKERQSITTFGPFITAAIGLDVELRGTLFSGGWQPNPLALLGAKFTRSLDIFADGERVQVPLTSTFEARETQTIEILGVRRELRRVVEAIRFGGRTRHQNEYWVDPSTGRCWKSRQLAIPTMPPVNLEVTKYPTV